jgi:hypothetical protein
MAVFGYTVRCYRETPGDAGCRDMPAFGETMDDMITLAGQMLLANAGDAARRVEARPTQADLVDADGAVLARLRVSGPDTVERVLY